MIHIITVLAKYNDSHNPNLLALICKSKRGAAMSSKTSEYKENLNESNILLSEQLLETWLSFTSTVRNERIVKGFTFREIFILHILANQDTCKTSAAKSDTCKSSASKSDTCKSSASKSDTCKTSAAKSVQKNIPDRNITATDIVNQTSILKPQVNKILDSLESRKLIKRQRSDKDKRYVFISLTPYGRRQYLHEHKNIIDLIEQLISSLGESNTRKLISNLDSTAVIIGKLISTDRS